MEKVVPSLYFVILMVTNSAFLVEGIRCYACDSTAHVDVCGRGFKLTPSNTSYIVDNCDYCSQYHFASDRVVIRSCAKDTSDLRWTTGCDSCKISGSTVRSCYCNDDLCNSATSWKSGILVIVTVVACLLTKKDDI